MPSCTQCAMPCNCYIDEDGYRAERPQDGRHNITVSGSATIEDPLTFSFLQSEFYRPPAAEVRKTTLIVPTGVGTPAGNTFDVTVYQTPNSISLIPAPVGIISPILITHNNFYMCGASATFPANATGERHISIVSANPFTDEVYQVAGNAQPALASRTSKLTCSGFVQGYLDNTGFINAGYLDPRTTPFIVSVYQTSGSDMVVSNIKLWVSKI